MGLFAHYFLFFAKTFTLVIAILLVVAGIVAITAKGDDKNKLKIKNLNDEHDEQKEALLKEILDKKAYKAHLKEAKKSKKSEKSAHKAYVIPFVGDINASTVTELKEAITLVLSVATPNDEVIIPIESGGGTVNGYGLAAAQIARIRDKNIPVTACIDKIAASGGYLMASVANKIIAAPFAIIGSIGVVAQMPNFHRFLKKHEVDVELITAGEHKRTLTLFGENTDEDREKFTENLVEIHHAFKNSITKYRNKVDIKEVANGDYWLAEKAFELKLVDEIKDSDSYLCQKMETYDVFELTKTQKIPLIKKLINGQSQFSLQPLREIFTRIFPNFK